MFRMFTTRFIIGVAVIVLLLAAFVLLVPRGSMPREAIGNEENGSLATTPPSPGESPPPTPPIQPKTPAPVRATPPPLPLMTFITPSVGETMTMGKSYFIHWNRGSLQTGSLMLLNASTQQPVGWVLSTVERMQTGNEWSVRSVFLGRGSPLAKDIVPGTYILRLVFDAPGPDTSIESPPFSILAAI